MTIHAYYIYVMFWKREILEYKQTSSMEGKHTGKIIKKLMSYVGITNNIKRRIKDHLSEKGCRTTNRLIKAYGKPSIIKYKEIPEKVYMEGINGYERTFKNNSVERKFTLSKNWRRVL